MNKLGSFRSLVYPIILPPEEIIKNIKERSSYTDAILNIFLGNLIFNTFLTLLFQFSINQSLIIFFTTVLVTVFFIGIILMAVAILGLWGNSANHTPEVKLFFLLFVISLVVIILTAIGLTILNYLLKNC